jgi:hypothetical protein
MNCSPTKVVHFIRPEKVWSGIWKKNSGKAFKNFWCSAYVHIFKEKIHKLESINKNVPSLAIVKNQKHVGCFDPVAKNHATSRDVIYESPIDQSARIDMCESKGMFTYSHHQGMDARRVL